VSTEYLFRAIQDGDYWLVDNRSLVIRGERGPVYARRHDAAAASTRWTCR
jgi:hypothetical protein